MNLDQFIAKWTNQVASFDGIPANAGQCVQLVQFYATEVLNLKPFYANAVDWWNNYGGSLTALTKVPDDTATTFPKRGDIVIWEGSLPNSGGFGHIDICVQDGNASGFLGFDSNWAGKFAHEVQHNYQYILGYLRPEENMPSLATADDVKRLLLAYFTPDQITAAGGDQYITDNVGTELSSLIQAFADSPQFLAKRQQEDTAPAQIAQIKGIVG